MQVHWFTVIAQIINFFILVLLLKRFLYRPVVEAMEARQRRIGASLEQARQSIADASKQKELYTSECEQLGQQREALLEEMRLEVQQERQTLMARVRDEVDLRQAHWQEEVEREKDGFIRALHDSLGQNAVKTVRHILKDMSDSQLEERVISVFLRRVDRLPEKDKLQLRQGPLLVQSGFSLGEQQQKSITDALAGAVGESIDVSFKVTPELICGLSVSSPSCSVAWNINSYMGDLESEFHNWFDHSGKAWKQHAC